MEVTPHLKKRILKAVKTLYFGYGYTMDGMIEPSKGTGYERVAMESDAFFEDTSSPFLIQFPKATGDQGVISFVAAWNKPTGGEMLLWWNISPTKISSGTRLVAAPVGLTIRFR